MALLGRIVALVAPQSRRSSSWRRRCSCSSASARRSTLPIDAVPDITNVQVQIITRRAGALAGRGRAVRDACRSSARWPASPKSTEVRSISKYGLSVVTVVFDDGTDIYFARQLVSERMREAEEAVPPQYGTPEMGPITTGLGEIYQFVVQRRAATR